MESKSNIIVSTLILIVGLAFLNSWIGNPFEDFLLKFFTDITEGKLTYAEEYEEYDDNGNLHTYYGYTYEYKINDRLIEKSEFHEGYLNDEFYGVTDINPKPIEIEYVYFLPTLSQVKGSGYPSTFWYMLKSLILKSILYIGIFVYYWKHIKDDVLNLIRTYFNKEDNIPNETEFNWKYHFFSFALDYLLILLAIGIFSLPSLFLKGGWFLFGMLLFIWGLMISYYLTERMTDGVSGILYCIVLAIVFFMLPSFTNIIMNSMETDSIIVRYCIMTFQITSIKWISEIVLTKIGYKIDYPIIEWIKEKRAYR